MNKEILIKELKENNYRTCMIVGSGDSSFLAFAGAHATIKLNKPLNKLSDKLLYLVDDYTWKRCSIEELINYVYDNDLLKDCRVIYNV